MPTIAQRPGHPTGCPGPSCSWGALILTSRFLALPLAFLSLLLPHLPLLLPDLLAFLSLVLPDLLALLAVLRVSLLILLGLTPDEQTISAYATAASSIVACSYSDGLR